MRDAWYKRVEKMYAPAGTRSEKQLSEINERLTSVQQGVEGVNEWKINLKEFTSKYIDQMTGGTATTIVTNLVAASTGIMSAWPYCPECGKAIPSILVGNKCPNCGSDFNE